MHPKSVKLYILKFHLCFPFQRVRVSYRWVFIFLCLAVFSGCVRIYQRDGFNQGRAQLPGEVEAYYSEGQSYSQVTEFAVLPFKHYIIRRMMLETPHGRVTFDFYQLRDSSSDELVMVYPVLGGKPILESHFADYIARNGYEAVVVKRNDEFKNPANFLRLESLFRRDLILDRVVLDYFEKELGKRKFAGFGISRGAINLAMLAGVEPRLRTNVLVLGGTDLAGIFVDSKERRVNKIINSVRVKYGLEGEELREYLKKNLHTDPRNLAHYMDPDHTLLILAAFDRSVPFSYGLKLRDQIGKPDTVFLLADHYTSVLFTQAVRILPPVRDYSVFPIEYIESKIVTFLDQELRQESSWWRLLPLRPFEIVLDLVGNGLAFFIDSRADLKRCED